MLDTVQSALGVVIFLCAVCSLWAGCSHSCRLISCRILYGGSGEQQVPCVPSCLHDRLCLHLCLGR